VAYIPTLFVSEDNTVSNGMMGWKEKVVAHSDDVLRNVLSCGLVEITGSWADGTESIFQCKYIWKQ